MKHFVADPPIESFTLAQAQGVSHNQIHIINPFWDASGGSEWRAISLFEGLNPYRKVSLWSEFDPDPRLLARYPIKKICETVFPKTGIFVFIGSYFPIDKWIYSTSPRRVILIHNTTLAKDHFTRVMRKMSIFDLKEIEIVYASKWLADTEKFPGRVENSLIDIERFAILKEHNPARADHFVIGRLSRDIAYKHHPNDPAFYLHLARSGFQVKVMGGICLSEELNGSEHILLLPTCYQEPQIFLQSLDCFFYRTAAEWTEPFGRVVVEAMACGLPVVVEDRGGYTNVIEHGRNGFLFRNEQEAFDILFRLRNDRYLCQSVGEAARATIEELYSPAQRWKILQYYLK